MAQGRGPQAFDPISRKVREAVYIAAGKVLDDIEYGPSAKQDGRSTFARLQGTYGAELRKLATDRPELSPLELAAAIIAPVEFPNDTEAAEVALSIISGVRDRARRSRYDEGHLADLSIPIPNDLHERIEVLRQLVREGAEAQKDRPPHVKPPFERKYQVVPRFVYDCLRRPPMD